MIVGDNFQDHMYEQLPERESLAQATVSSMDTQDVNNQSQHDARRAICETCPSKTTFTGVDLCTACGCVIYFKTWVKSESCPESKW